MEKWVIRNKKADWFTLGERLHVDPVVARLMVNRDVSEEEMERYLHGSRENVRDPYLLKDVERAAELLQAAIIQKEKICIIGDYDIDGINATYILYKALSELGGEVIYRIPDRILDGYGVNQRLIDQAKSENAKLIITCDNGIAAYDEIVYAKSLGLGVIITDHHDVPYELEEDKKRYRIPPADAVVNPKQEDCNYPFSGICGAVVAWKLMMVLYDTMGQSRDAVWDLVENAAFATVGDVMELKDENRQIVKEGLAGLSFTSNLGMEALIQENTLGGKELGSYHLGFVLGPCFNAGGRLDHAQRVMELLLEKNPDKAREQAQELVSLNESRKNLTEQGVLEAISQVEAYGYELPKVLCIYLPKCHESIAGIIAGRLREKYQRPAFVITGEEKIVKGSGRSIEAYPMYEQMSQIKDVFVKFGGHPLAAGFSLEKNRIEEMRDRLNANANLTEEDFCEKIWIDFIMPIDYVTLPLVEEFKLLEPFGNGNEKPVFADRDVTVTSMKRIGKDGRFLKLRLEKNGRGIDGVYFGDAESILSYWEENMGKEAVIAALSGRGDWKVSFVYYPEINTYMGKSSVQIMIQRFYMG